MEIILDLFTEFCLMFQRLKFLRAEESLTILSKFCKGEFVTIFVLKPFFVLILGRGFSNQISALEMTTTGKVKRVIQI